MKRLLLITGFLLLFIPEILRVYLIMPFPGSQQSNSIGIAYWLNNYMVWFRTLGLVLIAYPMWYVLTCSKWWPKVLVLLPLIVYGIVFYFFNYRFQADKMFYQPKVLSFHTDLTRPEQLVIGVVVNGEAKAYPIEVIGYHHQVRDVVGNMPVMITYCTVCRTGRVYSPVVDGRVENFRLVGMDHFNAMFEDATTKSWWQQATGIAVAGQLKGHVLREIPSSQMTLGAWLRWHPQSAVMQRDTTFKKQYQDLAGYDRGTLKSSLEKRDSLSWRFKSWVIGVVYDGMARAYDWNDLTAGRLIQDSIGSLPIMLVLEKDTSSFHVWSREIDGMTLSFTMKRGADSFIDIGTGSEWAMNGECTAGKLKGARLMPIQAYQEFWHSWKTFHPHTTRLYRTTRR